MILHAPNSFGKFAASLEAVSYTHLDVYKRQLRIRIAQAFEMNYRRLGIQAQLFCRFLLPGYPEVQHLGGGNQPFGAHLVIEAGDRLEKAPLTF